MMENDWVHLLVGNLQKPQNLDLYLDEMKVEDLNEKKVYLALLLYSSSDALAIIDRLELNKATIA